MELLERAVGYARGSLGLVTPNALANPTPCPGWDLQDLLWHVADSLHALREAVDFGDVDLIPRHDVGDPVVAVKAGICGLLGAWAAHDRRRDMSVAGRPITTDAVADTGALEIAVHGWDVAVACGAARVIPPALAEKLLDIASSLVTDADRPQRFAPPVAVGPDAGASDRLLAFLGRWP